MAWKQANNMAADMEKAQSHKASTKGSLLTLLDNSSEQRSFAQTMQNHAMIELSIGLQSRACIDVACQNQHWFVCSQQFRTSNTTSKHCMVTWLYGLEPKSGQFLVAGIGQGNGARPQIWAVVSTPILNLLRQEGYGVAFKAAISSDQIQFVRYSFVDNMDLIQWPNHLLNSSWNITNDAGSSRPLERWPASHSGGTSSSKIILVHNWLWMEKRMLVLCSQERRKWSAMDDGPVHQHQRSLLLQLTRQKQDEHWVST